MFNPKKIKTKKMLKMLKLEETKPSTFCRDMLKVFKFQRNVWRPWIATQNFPWNFNIVNISRKMFYVFQF